VHVVKHCYAIPLPPAAEKHSYVWSPPPPKKNQEANDEDDPLCVAEVLSKYSEPDAFDNQMLHLRGVAAAEGEQPPEWRLSSWFVEQCFVDNEKVFFLDLETLKWNTGFVKQSLFIGEDEFPEDVAQRDSGVYCVLLALDGELHTVWNKFVRRYCSPHFRVNDPVLVYRETVTEGQTRCRQGVFVNGPDTVNFLDPNTSASVRFGDTNGAEDAVESIRLSHIIPVMNAQTWATMLVYDEITDSHFYSDVFILSQNEGGNGFANVMSCDAYTIHGQESEVLTESLVPLRFSVDVFSQVHIPWDIAKPALFPGESDPQSGEGPADDEENPTVHGVIVGFDAEHGSASVHCNRDSISQIAEDKMVEGDDVSLVVPNIPHSKLVPVYERGNMLDVLRPETKAWAQCFLLSVNGPDKKSVDVITFEQEILKDVPIHHVRPRLNTVYEFDQVTFDSGQGKWRVGFVEAVFQQTCDVRVASTDVQTSDGDGSDTRFFPRFNNMIMALNTGDAVSVLDPDFDGTNANLPVDDSSITSLSKEGAIVSAVIMDVLPCGFPYEQTFNVLTLSGKFIPSLSWRSITKRFFRFSVADKVQVWPGVLCVADTCTIVDLNNTVFVSQVLCKDESVDSVSFCWRDGVVTGIDAQTQTHTVDVEPYNGVPAATLEHITCSRMRIGIEVRTDCGRALVSHVLANFDCDRMLQVGAHVEVLDKNKKEHVLGLVAGKVCIV